MTHVDEMLANRKNQKGSEADSPPKAIGQHTLISRIIDSWHFSDDWIGSPQDRCRYPSFRSLCYFGAGLDTDRAASLFGVDSDTVASWGAADQAPPQVWRTLLALAGEFEAISARWKGWRIHLGKLHAPDLADGFTTGQIRALPFLQGALDAYRRQGIPNRPDASTVHESKASAPVKRKAGNRPDASTVQDEEGRSPLGRDAGFGKPSILPAAYADGARSRHPDRPTDRSDPMDRSGPRLDVNRVSMRLQRKSFDPGFDFVGSIDKPQELEAGEGEGEARRRGATALPESLPLPGAGRKRPTRTPAEHRQGRIIDIMLNDAWTSRAGIEQANTQASFHWSDASQLDTTGSPFVSLRSGDVVFDFPGEKPGPHFRCGRNVFLQGFSGSLWLLPIS
jgi:hypothetical protein